MRPALLALAVASCSSRSPQLATPPPVAKPPQPVATPSPEATKSPKSYTLVADTTIEWKKHKCHLSIYPWDHDYDDDDKPPPPPDPPDPYVGPSSCADGGCGKTLDDKLAEINKTRPDEGVCDTRHRYDLEAALAKSTATPATSTKPWDHKAPLEYHALVRDALALTADEDTLLAKNGFVVPERLGFADYTTAYYDVHRGQLPVYITADSILHAVYASNDQLISSIERERLALELDAALGKMHCGLALAAKDYPPDIANDVDLYLTVARSLLSNGNSPVPSELGAVDGMVASIVNAITYPQDGMGTVELFGRERAFDVSQYTPRGHYVNGLEQYFRAAMWLSRMELDLAVRDSRSSIHGWEPDPRETPREATVALALADLAERTKATPHLASLDRAWEILAGRREDVSLAELGKLRAKAGIKSLRETDVAERLRTAIGNGYVRTVNVSPMPNVQRLPVIATVIGARITPDTVAMRSFIEERGDKHKPVELGYMLGHDRALAYADPDVKPQLDSARGRLASAPFGDDLYSHWLAAIRGLARTEQGARPGFMTTDAFADLRLDSALAAYGQLRHNHVLIQAQIYDQGGCEIPDGYVEPALATYQALAEYAKQGRLTFKALDPKDTASGVAYFTRLEKLMTVLVALSKEELGGRPLSAAAKRFLAMVVERRETSGWGYSGTFPLATYDGWYVDLFPSLDVAFKDTTFIIDYATYNRDTGSGIHYLGAHQARLGVFVVDTGGKPRVMVGPVANAFEHTGPLAKRLTDEDAAAVAGSAPWAASYTVKATPEPALAIEYFRELPKRSRVGPLGPRSLRPNSKDALAENTLRLDGAPGTVTVELLDHHFVKMGSVTVKLTGKPVDTVLAKQPRPIESLRVIRGAFTKRVDLTLDGYVGRRFGDLAKVGNRSAVRPKSTDLDD